MMDLLGHYDRSQKAPTPELLAAPSVTEVANETTVSSTG